MTRPLKLACLALLLAGVARAAVPSLTASVPISPRPVAVAVDPGTHIVYVADVETGEVVTFDGGKGLITGSVSVDGQPASLAVDTAGRRLFVGNRVPDAAAVSVINTGNGNARAFDRRGRVQGLAFDSETKQLFAGDPDTGELLVMNGETGEVLERVKLGGAPAGVVVNKRDGEVAVAVQGPAPALALLDPQSGNVVTVPVPEGQPLHVAVDSGTGKFFVTRGGASPALLVLRPGSSTFDNAIAIAPGPTGLAVDSRTSRIYLSHGGPSQATIIDGATGRPVAVVPLGDTSNHIAIDEGSTPTRVYSVDTTSGLLTVLTDQ